MQTLALPLGYVTKQEKEQAVAPFSFAERATRISPKRRLRRIPRGEIEEAAGELPAKAGKATIAATVSADGARKMKWSGRRGFRRSAACGGYSEAKSRKRRENCPQGRARRPLPRR
ncbi:MAG: hypothetical protein PUC24_06330 [Oscillospiraceae bacterium]|nr:hypothetical protein [Oscillospiraceae bacterium]